MSTMLMSNAASCINIHTYTHTHPCIQHSGYQEGSILKKISYSENTIFSVPPPYLHAVDADVTVQGEFYTHHTFLLF